MGNRVFRGYDKTAQERGSSIRIPAPAPLTVSNGGSAAQDLTASGVEILLNNWKEVRFKLTDKELSYTGEEIINQHIAPAAYALADNIDTALWGLYKDIPTVYGTAGTTPSAITDLTGVRKLLQNQNVPDDGQRYLAAFNTNAGVTSATAGVMFKGTIGDRFGMNVWETQNSPLHTKGTAALTTPVCTAAIGDTTVTITGTSGSGTLVAGDVIQIGSGDYYSIATGGTFSSTTGTFVLAQAIRSTKTGSTVTLPINTHQANLAFHKNAFALAMAPLSDLAARVDGHKMSVINYDGLSLRSRIYADGASSAIVVVLDVLYGVKTLNPNMAARLIG
jgi:hypothetical protein